MYSPLSKILCLVLSYPEIQPLDLIEEIPEQYVPKYWCCSPKHKLLLFQKYIPFGKFFEGYEPCRSELMHVKTDAFKTQE